MKKNPKYQKLVQALQAKPIFSVAEAVELIKNNKIENFDAGLELHLRLGIDPKKTDQQVKGLIILPHGTGKTKKIAAFVSAEQMADAKAAGADIVGGEELIEEIKKTSKTDFDLAVATPQIMPKLAAIAKILGTRGLMPSPKNETVTPNIKKAIEELKKGKVAFKNDDTCNIHQLVGRSSFEAQQLVENINVLLEAIKKAKPAGAKGVYIKSASLCTTMGPSIKIAVE